MNKIIVLILIGVLFVSFGCLKSEEMQMADYNVIQRESFHEETKLRIIDDNYRIVLRNAEANGTSTLEINETYYEVAAIQCQAVIDSLEEVKKYEKKHSDIVDYMFADHGSPTQGDIDFYNEVLVKLKNKEDISK